MESALKSVDSAAVGKNTTLRDLREGDRAIITAITGNSEFKHRLLEMGFTPGTVILVKKYAPLRDPIEFVLKGCHVSLRREEAEMVVVRQATCPGPQRWRKRRGAGHNA